MRSKDTLIRAFARNILPSELAGFVAVAGSMLLAVKMQMLPLPLFVVLAALDEFRLGTRLDGRGVDPS